jgi:hypothetical protein
MKSRRHTARRLGLSQQLRPPGVSWWMECEHCSCSRSMSHGTVSFKTYLLCSSHFVRDWDLTRAKATATTHPTFRKRGPRHANISRKHRAHLMRTAPRSTMAILFTSSSRLKIFVEFTWLGTTYTASANEPPLTSSLQTGPTTHASSHYVTDLPQHRTLECSSKPSVRALHHNSSTLRPQKCSTSITNSAFTQSPPMCSRTYRALVPWITAVVAETDRHVHVAVCKQTR